MHRFLTIGAISLMLAAASPRADAGHMYLEWLDCDPTYKLWGVSWKGPWNVLGGKHLDKATSNIGPWTRVSSFVADYSCMFPAQNLRWYRIASPKLLTGFQTLAAIWVPLSKCRTGSFR